MSEDERREKPQEPDPNRDPRTGYFLPGNHANNNGRPKGSRSLTSILRKLLEEKLDPKGDDESPTRADAFIAGVLANADSGNGTCIKEVFERMDGKVPERHEVKLGGDWSMEPIETTTPSKDVDEAGEVVDE